MKPSFPTCINQYYRGSLRLAQGHNLGPVGLDRQALEPKSKTTTGIPHGHCLTTFENIKRVIYALII